MRFEVITIFPEMIHQASAYGVVGQAVKQGFVRVGAVNPRDFAQGVHKAVDDRPFGGGDGMVMMPEPLSAAVKAARARLADGEAAGVAPSTPTPDGATEAGRLIYLSPRGRPFDDALARELSAEPGLVLLCGRYGGVDQRLLEGHGAEEISIGDFVLSGGELGALMVIDAVARLLPGVLGNEASPHNESFSNGLLEHPQFTRPRIWGDLEVPEVLMGGHHAQIEAWRRSLSIIITAQNRPDLLAKTRLTAKELAKARALVLNLAENEARACGVRDRTTVAEILAHWEERA